MPISSGANAWPARHYGGTVEPEPSSDTFVVVKKPPMSPSHPIIVENIEEPRPILMTKRPIIVEKPRPPRPYPEPEEQPPGDCCGGYGSCGPMGIYTTSLAGTNAGCCTGGLFSERKYPFDPDNEYTLKGTGCKRCCACCWGFCCAFFILGLLLGGLLGLKPYLDAEAAKLQFLQDYPGGYFIDGIYYYPLLVDDNYFIMYQNYDPCNPDNNSTNVPPELPNCDSVTAKPVVAVPVEVKELPGKRYGTYKKQT